MAREHQPHNMDEVMDATRVAGKDPDFVSVGDMLDRVGQRSFGPLLLVLALIAFTPLGGIPGLPTTLAMMVVLTAGQALLGRSHFWLPKFILRRSISREKLQNAIYYLRPVAEAIDKLARPRLAWLVRGVFLRVAAGGCILVALTVPPLELVPFAGTISWLAIGAFGLAIVARDGVLALIALAFAVGGAIAAWNLLL